MNRTEKIIITIVIVTILIVVGYITISLLNKKTQSNLPEVNSAEDLVTLVGNIYKEIPEDSLPIVENQILDVTNNDTVKYVTGLDNGSNLEYIVVSEPLMSSQAYSLVLAKVKAGVNANEVAKEMSEKIDTRKWICVEAEQLYATSSGDIVFLVMSNQEMAKSIYENFKTLSGTMNEVYEKVAEEIELPSEMY